MDLIPKLPDDIARECLLRVPYTQFAAVASTCKAWKAEIQLPDFFRRRKAASHAQKLLGMVQARSDPNKKSGYCKWLLGNPVYMLTLLEPDTGDWMELPPVPWLPHGLPLFCQVAAVGSELVVMGGYEPVSWEVSRSVFVFSFLSAKWRRATEMPGAVRLFFGCASDGERMVYVAGGHDGNKDALKTALTYDVTRDEWVQLPDMAKERDECKGIFHGGKFHVIGGYRTARQGSFKRSAETFDVAAWRWESVRQDLLEGRSSPRTCIAGSGGGDDVEYYMCHGNEVVGLKGSTWQGIARLPAEEPNVACMATWQGKLLVIASSRFSEPHMGYMLDLKTKAWTILDTPEKYSGHVQSGCYFEI